MNYSLKMEIILMKTGGKNIPPPMVLYVICSPKGDDERYDEQDDKQKMLEVQELKNNYML